MPLLVRMFLFPRRTVSSFFSAFSSTFTEIPSFWTIGFSRRIKLKLVPLMSHLLKASLYRISARGCLISFSTRATISQTLDYGKLYERTTCQSMLSILVNRVPVLSKAMTFAFFIFSKTALFLMRIPLFVAMLRTIAITLGTAKPRAHGQEATKTLIPR